MKASKLVKSRPRIGRTVAAAQQGNEYLRIAVRRMTPCTADSASKRAVTRRQYTSRCVSYFRSRVTTSFQMIPLLTHRRHPDPTRV